jgi:hypothetical protein
MSQDGYYPLFLNWNSALLDSAIEDLLYMRQGRTALYWGPASAPLAMLVALGTGMLRAPLVWGQMLSSDLNATGIKALAFTGKRNSKVLAEQLLNLYASRDAAAIPLSLPAEQITTWESTMAGIRYVVTLPTKLLLSPLIDGLGQRAWGNMSRRTQMLFYREDEFDVRHYRENSDRLRQALVQGCSGAAHKLFLCLQQYLSVHPAIQVTLIGHSMGTIVLNRVLREFPNLRVDNLVYMAAACSIDSFRASVIPYLKNMSSAKFYNLMLHPAAEVREWQARLLDITPRGSLLVWIDNFLAAPETTLDRTLGCWENVMQTAHVIPKEVRSRTTFKAFGFGGSDCNAPTTHGALTHHSYGFWRPDFWQMP